MTGAWVPENLSPGEEAFLCLVGPVDCLTCERDPGAPPHEDGLQLSLEDF